MITTDLIISNLRAAWKLVREGKGGHCPVCDRWGKNNDYHLNTVLVRMLVDLYTRQQTLGPGVWMNMPRNDNPTIRRTVQYSKLAYWGFFEPFSGVIPDEDEQPEQPEPPQFTKKGKLKNPKKKAKKSTKGSGLWRVTPKAEAWLKNQIKVPETVWVYNSHVVGVGVKEIGPSEVFTEGFDYNATMANTWDYWAGLGEIIVK